ncbi:PaaI family thioesterase [uncultured Desulfosarcina sp.]|uniref:PaaI family thioesterase n=1 Tax=uncultured Desulfosarcina sp. TaxID=218289 RepID=UPI0029C88150|nr:PaaI family thioesterase [uncultured Desulfosarcina sp.]
MASPNPAYIGALINVVNSSPFPTHMLMQLKVIAFDHAVVSLKTDTCHLQPYGIVHGGVLATLIDTATFWASFLRLPDDDGLVNIDLKLNYLKPVAEGTLTATGRCIRSGRSLSYAEAGVTDADGKLVAHGTSTLMALPGKGLAFKMNKFLED